MAVGQGTAELEGDARADLGEAVGAAAGPFAETVHRLDRLARRVGMQLRRLARRPADGFKLVEFLTVVGGELEKGAVFARLGAVDDRPQGTVAADQHGRARRPQRQQLGHFLIPVPLRH